MNASHDALGLSPNDLLVVIIALAFVVAIAIEFREMLLLLYDRMMFYLNDPRRPRRGPPKARDVRSSESRHVCWNSPKRVAHWPVAAGSAKPRSGQRLGRLGTLSQRASPSARPELEPEAPTLPQSLT